MSSRAEKEKQRQIQDKCQMILNQLLREEDNKYCVDCDAKGPRWASWNLGIFLCIRCAGIHRNLGVHISKVKSVNLDTWNPDQVAYLQNMGNSQARAIYEANLPDNFRRPQTDSMLESFIRAKYETKKYIAKEWVPPPPPKPAFDIEEEWRKEKERRRLKNKNAAANTTTQPQAAVPRPQAATPPPLPKVAAAESSSVDLLGLDIPSSTPAPEQPTPAATDPFDNFLIQPTDNKPQEQQENLFQAPAAQPVEKKAAPMSKESILSLYSSAAAPSPMGYMPMGGFQNMAFPVAPANGLVMPPAAATNPFLAPAAGPAPPTAYHWQPPAASISQVQHQMAGLQMGPPQAVNAPWMAGPQTGGPPSQPDHQGTWPTLSTNLWH